MKAWAGGPDYLQEDTYLTTKIYSQVDQSKKAAEKEKKGYP